MTGNAVASTETTVKQQSWGAGPDGTPIVLYTLTTKHMEVQLMSYGARVVRIKTPDRQGKMQDVVLGYDSIEQYLKDKRTHFGATIGRYANRIAYGRFNLLGKSYSIPVNNGQNALHGGSIGFDQLVWKDHPRSDGVDFTLVSKDGDMGFPGALHVTVSYKLKQNKLTIKYLASTDHTTVINLTNHAYFNLNGDDQGSILDHLVYLNADRYTPVAQDLIPTGTEDDVDGTPLDFRHAVAVGARIGQPYEQLKFAGGYDHNFVLNGEQDRLRIAASVYDPASGRKLSVWTTEPGIQFYSGNFLDGSFTGRHGVRYERNTGLCLETQHFPDSPNHTGFPSTVLSPGHPFSSTTIWDFEVADAHGGMPK